MESLVGEKACNEEIASTAEASVDSSSRQTESSFNITYHRQRITFTRSDFELFFNKIVLIVGKNKPLPSMPLNTQSSYQQYFDALKKRRSQQLLNVIKEFADQNQVLSKEDEMNQEIETEKAEKPRKHISKPVVADDLEKQIKKGMAKEDQKALNLLKKNICKSEKNPNSQKIRLNQQLKRSLGKQMEEGRINFNNDSFDDNLFLEENSIFQGKNLQCLFSTSSQMQEEQQQKTQFQPKQQPYQQQQNNIVTTPNPMTMTKGNANKNKVISAQNQKRLKEYYAGYKKIGVISKQFQNEQKFCGMLEKVIELESSTEESEKEKAQNYSCSICLQLPMVPLQCKKCTMMICAGCAFECLETCKECPICCQSPWEIQRPIDSILTWILESSRYSCEYSSFGCSETLTPLNILNHEDNCNFRAVPCEMCQEKIVINQMVEHNQICPMLQIKCKQCTFSYARKEEKQHDCIKSTTNAYKQLQEEFKLYKDETEEKLIRFEQMVKDATEKISQFHRSSNYQSNYHKFMEKKENRQKYIRYNPQKFPQPISSGFKRFSQLPSGILPPGAGFKNSELNPISFFQNPIQPIASQPVNNMTSSIVFQEETADNLWEEQWGSILENIEDNPPMLFGSVNQYSGNSKEKNPIQALEKPFQSVIKLSKEQNLNTNNLNIDNIFNEFHTSQQVEVNNNLQDNSIIINQQKLPTAKSQSFQSRLSIKNGFNDNQQVDIKPQSQQQQEQQIIKQNKQEQESQISAKSFQFISGLVNAQNVPTSSISHSFFQPFNPPTTNQNSFCDSTNGGLFNL